MHTEHNMKLLYAALLLLLPFTAHSAGVIVAINGTNTLVDNQENLVLQWKVPNEHNNINLKTWELVRGKKTLANGFGDAATISKAVIDQYDNRLEVTKSGEIVTFTIHLVSGEDADTYTLFGAYDRNAAQESASTTFKVKGYTPPAASDESGSLSLTVIIVIVICSILFLAIVIVLCMYYVRNKRRDRTDEESSHPMRYRKNDDKEYQIPSEPGEPLVSTKPPSAPERPPNKPPHKPSNKPPSAPTKPSAAPRKPPVAKKPLIAKKPVYSEHGPSGGRADVN